MWPRCGAPQRALPQVAFELEQGGVRTAAVSSLMLLMLGVGTTFGNLFAGLFSRRGVELGLAPIGGLLLMLALLFLGLVTPGSGLFTALLIVSGFASGLFLVPLYAFIQERAGDHRRGRILAGVSLLDSLAGALASGLYWLVASDARLGWSPVTQWFLLAALTLGMLVYALRHLPHQTVCTVMRIIGPLFYRVKEIGRAHV